MPAPDASSWTEALRILREGIGPVGCAVFLVMCYLVYYIDRTLRYSLREKEKEVERAVQDRNDWKFELYKERGKPVLPSSDDPKYAVDEGKPPPGKDSDVQSGGMR